MQALKARGHPIKDATKKVHDVFKILIENDEIRRKYYLDVKDQLIKQLTIDNE